MGKKSRTTFRKPSAESRSCDRMTGVAPAEGEVSVGLHKSVRKSALKSSGHRGNAAHFRVRVRCQRPMPDASRLRIQPGIRRYEKGSRDDAGRGVYAARMRSLSQSASSGGAIVSPSIRPFTAASARSARAAKSISATGARSSGFPAATTAATEHLPNTLLFQNGSSTTFLKRCRSPRRLCSRRSRSRCTRCM